MLDIQQNRAFLYGDSLFETIKVAQYRPLALDLHYQRLAQGLQKLHFAPITFDYFQQIIQQQIDAAQNANLRIRISFFRQGAGTYLPDISATTEHFIIASPLATSAYALVINELQIGICNTIKISADDFSALKTGSALRYVAAAMHAREHGWEDALLLNARNNIVEATFSNVFILKDQRLYTPPLSEGCVAGVMRRFLLEQYSLHPIQEQAISIEMLENADEIWLTNMIRGIRPLRSTPLFHRLLSQEKASECLSFLNDYWQL